MDAISHKLCLVRRLHPTDLQLSYAVEVSPITPSIGSRIAFRLRNVECSKHIRLYNDLTSLPSTKKMSGDVFEAYCQQRFSGHISIEFDPMICVLLEKKLKHQPQWHIGHTKFAPPSLEKERKVALKTSSLNVRPSSVFEYTSEDLHSRKLQIRPDVYYLPADPFKMGFDSFIMHKHILYLFQFTDAKTDIKDFVTFFDLCTGHPAQKDWRFIFVRPSDIDVTMKCVVPATDALRELALYSAEVAMK